MSKNNSNDLEDFIKAANKAGVPITIEVGGAKITINPNMEKVIEQPTEINEESIPEEAYNKSEVFEEESFVDENKKDKPNGLKWSEAYLYALTYNRKYGDIDNDKTREGQVSHIPKSTAQGLIKKVEAKVLKQEMRADMFRKLTEFTNYLYDIYSFNYSTKRSELFIGTDAMGSFVYHVEEAIIDTISPEHLQLNLAEAIEVIEATKSKYGNSIKLDDDKFLVVISTIACRPYGKELLDVILLGIDKFTCNQYSLKEFVAKTEVIIKKFNDIEGLKQIILSIEEENINLKEICERILKPLISLDLNTYQKFKKEKLSENSEDIRKISIDDLISMLENYKQVKKEKNTNTGADKINDILNNRKRRITKPQKTIKMKFTVKRVALMSTLGLTAITLGLTVKTMLFKGNTVRVDDNMKNSSEDIDNNKSNELEEELEDKPELPEAMQELDREYLMVLWEDPTSGKKIPAYLQLDRESEEIPDEGNTIIINSEESMVIENVNKDQITPLLTRYLYSEGNKMIETEDGIEIQEDEAIDILLDDKNNKEKSKKYEFLYDDGENVHRGVTTQSVINNMDFLDYYTVSSFEDQGETILLNTLMPLFFTAQDDIIATDGTKINKGQTFMGCKTITKEGKQVELIEILESGSTLPSGEVQEYSTILVHRVIGEDITKLTTNLDKYNLVKDSQNNLTSGFMPIAGAENVVLEGDVFLYPTDTIDTTGIPQYLVREGTQVALYKNDDTYFAGIELDGSIISGPINPEDWYVSELLDIYDKDRTRDEEEENTEDIANDEIEYTQEGENQGDTQDSLQNQESDDTSHDLDMSSFEEFQQINFPQDETIDDEYGEH